jgi:integrase
MKTRLTDMAVKKLAAPEAGQVTYWDELTPGFGLRCSPKSKSFVVMFGEKRRLKTLGRYPALSLSDARREARLFLSEASFGKHQETKVSYDFASRKFIADCESRLRPITVREYRRHLAFFKFKKDLGAIERSDVFQKLDELKLTPTNQNYAFTALKVFFNWCVRNQYIPHNPIAADKKPARLKSRERVLNDDELKALYTYVREERSLFHDMVALLILTGQRRTEIGHLRWDEIEDRCLELSADRTKNHRTHRLPLPPTVIKILETRQGASPYIFPGKDTEKPFNGIRRVKESLDAAVGIEHFTLHDLRRTLSSNMARLGVPIHVTEKILNHQSGSFGGVAGIYNRHSYFDEMKMALDQYNEYLENLINS